MNESSFGNTLLIGGTGMLANASVSIAERSERVWCVSRSQSSSAVIGKHCSSATQFHGVVADYTRCDDFIETVLQSIGTMAIDLALVWMHSSGGEAFDQLVAVLGTMPGQPTIVHVVGSSGAAPGFKYPENSGVDYRQVVLGFVRETSDNARWPTHAEISNGVLEAIETQSKHAIVGVIEPWSARP